MKKTLLVLLLLVCASIPSFAWGPYYGHGGWGGRGWGGRGWGPGGQAMFWTGFGLTCGALALGAASAYANPPVYYANPYPVYAPAPVVYQQPVVYQSAPQTIYIQQQQPNIVYTQPQPQTIVIQQPEAPAQPTQQSYSVRWQNTNGSTTVVPLRQSGNGWLGPQGEYYPAYPTVEQLSPRYQ